MVKLADIDLQTYEDLRKRLVDLTRRNRLLQFRHSSRAGIIRIVDENYDRVINQLRNGTRFRFKGLPDPEGDPADERSAEFQAALATARILDEEYKPAIAALDPDDPAAAAKEIQIERELRDRVRAQLDMPPRPHRRGLDLLSYARQHGVEPEFEIASPRAPLPAKHTDPWLQTLLFPDQLKAKTTAIARSSRSIEQETGVSTLHLAMAFLEWFESDSSDEAFLSPLLLMPVGLERYRPRGGQEEFRLIALDDAPTTNLSLELRLYQDFRLRLPSYDPDDEVSVQKYLAAVTSLVRQHSRWKIRRYFTLGTFSFARIAMYRDLHPENWKAGGGPVAHPLVQPILHGGIGGLTKRFADEYEIDKPEIEKIAPILVHDADSSQHSALIDAMQGKSIVIEGPPGTGKSQTISNLIANELYRGGTILFVSEKMAALDVVKSRLDAVGLGDFCLTLHATGAKPSAVIEALRIREAMQPPRSSGASYVDTKIVMPRSVLNTYLAAFHERIGPFGESAHDLIGRLSDLERNFPDLPVVRLRSRRAELPASIDGTAVMEARRKLGLLRASSVVAEKQDWYPVFRCFGRSTDQTCLVTNRTSFSKPFSSCPKPPSI